MEQREFIVEAEAAGQRIDRFLSGEDTGLSRSALQGLVAEGHVLCNGKSIAKSLKLPPGRSRLHRPARSVRLAAGLPRRHIP